MGRNASSGGRGGGGGGRSSGGGGFNALSIDASTQKVQVGNSSMSTPVTARVFTTNSGNQRIRFRAGNGTVLDYDVDNRSFLSGGKLTPIIKLSTAGNRLARNIVNAFRLPETK